MGSWRQQESQLIPALGGVSGVLFPILEETWLEKKAMGGYCFFKEIMALYIYEFVWTEKTIHINFMKMLFLNEYMYIAYKYI